MENNGLRRNNVNDGLLENTPFYRCIRPLLLFQKIGGGWIHRPLRSPNEKYQYYAFKIYCIVWELITIGVLIRTVFIFNKNVSIDIENLITIMQGSIVICLGIGQFFSFFKYRQVLPFWDGMIHMYPQKFHNGLNWSKFIIMTMVIISLCILATAVSSGFYLILKPEPDAAYIKLTEPWAGDVTEARVAYIITVICFLPPQHHLDGCRPWVPGSSLLPSMGIYGASPSHVWWHTVGQSTSIAQDSTFASVTIDRRLGWHSMGIYRSQHDHVHIWYVFCYLCFPREPQKLWNNGICFIAHPGFCHNGHHCRVQYLHQHLGKLMYTRRYHTESHGQDY